MSVIASGSRLGRGRIADLREEPLAGVADAHIDAVSGAEVMFASLGSEAADHSGFWRIVLGHGRILRLV